MSEPSPPKIFYSVPDLIASIENYLEAHNDDPKPFVWTASIDSILEKVGRCKAVLETVHCFRDGALVVLR